MDGPRRERKQPGGRGRQRSFPGDPNSFRRSSGHAELHPSRFPAGEGDFVRGAPGARRVFSCSREAISRPAGACLKTTLLVLLGALVLALYLWTALQAPVVLWSDSRTDLAWAKEGLGTFKPIPPPAPGKPIDHLPKPGYLLFLRGAMLAFPSLGEERSVIVVQSALLALSILGTALFLARRRGFATGAVAMLVCLI